MTAIDVGSAAINRATTSTANYTIVLLDNPANETGKITSVEIWAASNITGCKVATFSGSGTTYTSRDFETIGAVTSGSKQTFTGLDIDVVAGDFIGSYIATGGIERDTGGGGGWYYRINDRIDGSPYAYTLAATLHASLYGIGISGWSNIASVNGSASGDIAKVKGIAVADVAKVNGVAV